MKKLIFSVFFLVNAATTMAQDLGMIKGTVISKSTKEPIAGVSVSIPELKKITQSDTAGVFMFKNIPIGSHNIVTHFVGYAEKRTNDVFVLANKTTDVKIEIEESGVDDRQIVVSSERYEDAPLTPVSSYSFSREEIARNPGAQGDIFRALSMLPGISASGGEYSAIAARGQGTRDNVYTVDDIPVTQVSHLEGNGGSFNDPNGGRFSIFAPRVISDAEFQGGGFAAQYGRRSASHLGLTVKEGNREDYTVDGQLDLLGATINYDGPSYILDNTSLFISARYQNFGPLTRVVNRRDAGLPQYGDFIFKSSTKIGSASTLSALIIAAPEQYLRDVSNVRADTALNNLFLVDASNDKDLAGLTLTTLTGANSYWKNIAYFTTTHMVANFGTSFPKADSNGKLIDPDNIPADNNYERLNYRETEAGYRSIFYVNFKDHSSLTSGIDLGYVRLNNFRQLDRFDTLYMFGQNDSRLSPTTYYALVDPKYFNASFTGDAFNASAYSDYSLLIASTFRINAGLRYDYTGFTAQSTVSPRLSGSYQFDAATSLNFATGLYYQDPIYSEIADQPADQKLKEERVAEYILGLKTYLSDDWKVTVEGYYKKLDHLVVRPVKDESVQNNNGDGWAAGADVSITKRLADGLHGTLTYSYMQSKRNDHDGLGEYDFAFSQPHQLGALIGYKPNEHWVLSGKFKYSTGKPTDSYIIHSNIFNDPNYIRYSEETIGRNIDRLSDFISLDVRADYIFQFGNTSLTAFIDIVNVLNRQNEYQQYLNIITGKIFYDGLAIFPTFGLKFQF
ncbi:MAG TPA: carboxypeptidase-like regulatory domain-containing protein [Candidatus Kapabacteria bacterium]|nr:carboxypeptidase-like regulatory domain-containing protein [Candidatus Kapabacteria bacterium]